MAKLIAEEWLSIDGYAEDSNGKLDFFPAPETNVEADLDQNESLDSIGTIILARKTYEIFAAYWPNATTDKEVIADKLNAIPKVIISRSLQNAPWGKYKPARIVSQNIIETINQLKSESEKDLIIWGSLSLVEQLAKAKLIDEFRLNLCPVAVGGGKYFFPDSGQYSQFDLKSVKSYPNGMIRLVYKNPKVV